MQAPPLSAAESARILVTGAIGFIGTRLVAQLHGQSHRVIAIDLEPPRARLEGVAYDQTDVREALAPELGCGAERIYNFAAVHRTPGHPAHAYYETKVLGAVNVTALAEACGIETLVFTSSTSVYGPSEQVMTETSPLLSSPLLSSPLLSSPLRFTPPLPMAGPSGWLRCCTKRGGSAETGTG